MILDEIIRATEARVLHLADRPAIDTSYRPVSLQGAIRSAARARRHAVIAELKYASPSRGTLECAIPPEALAAEMIAGGCAALSVLTEPSYFSGSIENLSRVRRVADAPILRKDFIIDERQLYETRALGADAVLLIARVLGEELPSFVDLASALGLEPLVEVHTREEAEAALATDAGIIGINNRDLRTMAIDLNTTRRLSDLVHDEGRLVVSESGICWPYDIKQLRDCCDAFLIGSAIMSARNRQKRLEGFVFA
ncbi:MAG: indole-3-glycerol-phosphate synthase [Methanomicrobiaceae archaeon]|nr:indole-3-glycerol-phosphate synthase [Methanomicrobiaceae archaeon]MDD5419197.1 indole-3-glycerol-phosphate synthase [Methanomicrobiaceae archaeon]